jgi:hypothetical protein
MKNLQAIMQLADELGYETKDLIEYKEYLETEILDAYTDWVESHNEHNEHNDEGTEDLEIPYSFDEIEFIDEEAFTIGIQDTIDEYEAIRDFCQTNNIEIPFGVEY